MRDLSFINRAALIELGLSASDIQSFITARTRFGVINTEAELQRITAAFTPAARRRLSEAMASAPSDGDSSVEVSLNRLKLTIEPHPPMLADKDYRVLFSFNRQLDREQFELTEPFSLRGPNLFDIFDVSLLHLIHIRILNSDDEMLAERVLIPVPQSENDLSIGTPWRASAPLQSGERLGQDGNQLFARLMLDTLRPANPENPQNVPNTRFERQGRFQVVAEPRFRFDGYGMSLALVTDAMLPHLQAMLDTANGTTATSLRGAPGDTQLLQLLTLFSLRSAELDFDGNFNVDRNYSSFEGVIGWVWVLTGPDTIVGFRPDSEPELPQRDILILLAGGVTSIATGDLPHDVSEASLLSRPDLFADDPGSSCRPFSNPSRILGEKRFQTVLRVTQPKVAKAGALPRSFEEQFGRPVDFPRLGVDENNEVEYEDDPSQFQAQSVALGHVLEQAVRYRSNGYSLGDVAYSLTLAPRQKRRIMKLDYARRELSRRNESTTSDDEVMDALDRERDYDNAVSSELGEWSRGKSQTSSVSGSIGVSIPIGVAVIGGGVSAGRSKSSASQEGGREAGARESQHLRDAIRRYGQSVRSLESTIVTETEQSESIEAVSEVVQNINYTRSLSIIYYEILRHLRVDTEIASVTECVFVPMPIKRFTDERISRHRRVLSRYARGWLEKAVFRHLDDIQAGFIGSDLPAGKRADHALTELSGSLWLTMGINMPSEGPEFAEINANTDREVYERERLRLTENMFLGFAGLFPFPTSVIARKIVSASDAERERYFQGEIAPHMARVFLDELELFTEDHGALSADFTLVSAYRYGRTLRVDFTVDLDGSETRAQLVNSTLRIKKDSQTLPPRSYVNLTSARLDFATAYYRGTARSNTGTRDLINSVNGEPDLAGAAMIFRLTSADEMDLRKRLKEGYAEMKKTLEANTFRYHKAIWWAMDRDELYTLLDGYSISDEDGRSLASMAERSPIGILGNSLIFAIKTDVPVDPMFDNFQDLKNHYVMGLPPADPMRISLPTDGLYARAHMDECVAAEEHDGSFDWVFNNSELELADFPSNIFDSRRAEPQALVPTKFPDSIISLQNAPAAPNVSGLSDALAAVQNGSAFRDMAGLTGTQANARAALQSATELATSFGNMAFQQSMAQIAADGVAAKNVRAATSAVKHAVEAGGVDAATGKQVLGEYLARRLGGDAATDVSKNAKSLAEKVLNLRAGGSITTASGEGVQTITKNPDGEATSTSEGYDYTVPDPLPALKQDSPMSCWAATMTMLKAWRSRDANPSVAAFVDKLGEPYQTIFANDTGLIAKDKERLIAAAGLKTLDEGASSLSPRGYLDLLMEHGPIWVTVDVGDELNVAKHAIILRGIVGEKDNPEMRIIDPSDGQKRLLAFAEFQTRYERIAQETPVSIPLSIQLVVNDFGSAEGQADPVGEMDYNPLLDRFIVADSNAWLRDADENFKPIRDQQGNNISLPRSRVVVLRSNQQVAEVGRVVETVEPADGTTLGWTKYSNLVRLHDEDEQEYDQLSVLPIGNLEGQAFSDYIDYIKYRNGYFGSLNTYLKKRDLADSEFLALGSDLQKRIGVRNNTNLARKLLYRWLREAYHQEGISNPSEVIRTGMTKALRDKLNLIELEYQPATFSVSKVLVARPKIKDGRYRLGTLSNHATGKAVDITPQNLNPQISEESWEFIESTAGSPSIVRTLETWKDEPEKLWENVNALNIAYKAKLREMQDSGERLDAILRGHPKLLEAATNHGGFFNLSRELVMLFHKHDFIWGLTFRTPDLHHFDMA